MEYLNNSNFDAEIKEGITVVDFFANWCGPCRMLAPLLTECEKQYQGKVKFAKVDVDENNALAAKYDVMSIPNLIIFKDGQAVNQHIGYFSQEELQKFIDSAL